MSDYEVHVQHHYNLLQVCNGAAARMDEYEFEFYTQFSWSWVLPGQAVTFLSPCSSATNNPSTLDTPRQAPGDERARMEFKLGPLYF